MFPDNERRTLSSNCVEVERLADTIPAEAPLPGDGLRLEEYVFDSNPTEVSKELRKNPSGNETR
jgi:hypothetical protein